MIIFSKRRWALLVLFYVWFICINILHDFHMLSQDSTADSGKQKSNQANIISGRLTQVDFSATRLQ